MPVEKSLDAKLRSIHADPVGARDFILADAKDADMAFGMSAPGLMAGGSRSQLARFPGTFLNVAPANVVRLPKCVRSGPIVPAAFFTPLMVWQPTQAPEAKICAPWAAGAPGEAVTGLAS